MKKKMVLVPFFSRRLPVSSILLFSAILLVAGTLGVLFHKALWFTLAGMGLWALGFRVLLLVLTPGREFSFFSKNELLQWKPDKEGSQWGAFLISLMILGLLGGAQFSLIDRLWIPFFLSLLAIGGLLILLQNRSPAFESSPSNPRSRDLPWREFLLFGVAAFFWFYRLDQWPNRFGGENLNTLLLGRDFMENRITTPYYMEMDSYRWFPALLMGLFFKIVGFSYLKGLVLSAAINLTGVLFFFGVLKFFLPPNPAFVAALLYGSSYWVLFMGRQTFEGCSIITPFSIATLFFFLRAVEKGRPRDFAFFGVLMAFVLCNYLSSRFVLVFFLTTTLILWVLHRKDLLSQKTGWILGWGVFALTFFPMALFLFQTQKGFHIGGNSDRVAGLNIAAWCLQTGKWAPFLENLQQGLQMYTVRTTDDWMTWVPFLGPWEGIGLLAGLAWCFWRSWKPPFLIVLMGFFGGMCCAVLSNLPTNANRALAGSPFVYLLVGIGLDRLSRMVGSPLGKNWGKMAPLFLSGFLGLSLLWHYDVYFNRFPRTYRSTGGSGIPQFLAGKKLAQYPPGWDLYITSLMNSPYEIYSGSKEKMGALNFFYPRWDLPLSQVPARGAFLLLPYDLGSIEKEWIQYYYPGARRDQIQDPFGDIQYLSWEIGPDEIRQALTRGKLPPGGIPLRWYDPQHRCLGEWRLPTLAPGVQNWFNYLPGKENFPYGKTAFFVAKGWIRSPEGRTLALETNGDVDWTLGDKELHAKGPNFHRMEMKPVVGGWIPFKVRYRMKGNEYFLNLSRLDSEGWNEVPSIDLKP